jgi:myo-inositol-1(or 4)-monophosphatase
MTIDIADSTRLKEVAEQAAQAVAPPLLQVFRSAMGYGYKRDRHDIVTEHDRATEAQLVAAIRAAIPDSAFVGEEGGRSGEGRVCWYIDPIDGTSNFARGLANWCISIGAAVDGAIVAGVIYEPVAGNLFSADLGGARLNGRPIRARAYEDQEQAVLLTGFPGPKHLRRFGTLALEEQAKLLDAFLATRNLGSGALNLVHLACGWADAIIGFDTNPWDVAAGSFILAQAGGRYAGFRDGAPVDPGFLAPDFIAVGEGADYPSLGAAMRRLSGVRAPSRPVPATAEAG